MYTGGDWLQYFRCAAVVSDLRTHKEEKRERPENGSMRVPKMGECFCFLFWADMHYFAAMSTCLVLRGQRTASVSSTQ
ncbi:hypothetical protein POTOM_056359 [Populus tomentosa]|uniref:Uncharacterized protein n=1 Tax=Populus tomentosa TaxID=118781 RepID=A0A8X7Y8D7_POPTO|nr:hypothetical protein POTOM_056359 [Populus tomentosa]